MYTQKKKPIKNPLKKKSNNKPWSSTDSRCLRPNHLKINIIPPKNTSFFFKLISSPPPPQVRRIILISFLLLKDQKI